jgi:hypothetical protein
MDHELRAMALSMAVTLLAGSNSSSYEAIEAAKEFVKYIEGTGLTSGINPLGSAFGTH